jgi:hypothetical protein
MREARSSSPSSARTLTRERPLELGDRIEVGGQDAIVRTIEPLLGEPELRLVLRLRLDCS